MPPNAKENVPFLTRKDLQFEHGTRFDLEVNVQTSLSLTVFIRGMTREGLFNFRFVPTGGASIETRTFAIPDIPIFMSIHEDGIAAKPGGTYISVNLRANNNILHQLVGGFLETQKALTWPSTNGMDMVPGRGEIETMLSANPAAGAEATIEVPVNEMWRIRAISIQLVTDANVADRRVHFTVNTSVAPSINFFGSADQTAGQTRNYTAAIFGHIPDELDDDDILLPLPTELWVEGGFDIATETTNLQATDNFGIMSVHIERFWTGLE